MKRNVLFLDFDGPLTNRRSYIAFDSHVPDRMLWTTADPVAIGMLNQLYRKHNFVTVISSTWRMHSETNKNPTGLSAIESLKLWGYIGDFHHDWCTPRLTDRHQEIKSWLLDHKNEVLNYASLDDIQLKKWTNNVNVDEQNGMMYDDYIKLGNMLSGGGWSMDKFLNHFGFGV